MEICDIESTSNIGMSLFWTVQPASNGNNIELNSLMVNNLNQITPRILSPDWQFLLCIIHLNTPMVFC